MERTALLVAVTVFGCLLLAVAWRQRGKPPSETQRLRTAKFMSLHWALEAFRAIALAVLCSVFAVIEAVQGDWENAAIPAGLALACILFAVVQGSLARTERDKLD
jgi:xanthine/uracil permease